MAAALIIACVFLAAAVLGWYFAHQNMQNMRSAWESTRKELSDMSFAWQHEYERRVAYENAFKQAKENAQQEPTHA